MSHEVNLFRTVYKDDIVLLLDAKISQLPNVLLKRNI